MDQLDNKGPIAIVILEYALPCGIPFDVMPKWRRYQDLSPIWNSNWEQNEHVKCHDKHKCLIVPADAWPPSAKKKKKYVYDD